MKETMHLAAAPYNFSQSCKDGEHLANGIEQMTYRGEDFEEGAFELFAVAPRRQTLQE